MFFLFWLALVVPGCCFVLRNGTGTVEILHFPSAEINTAGLDGYVAGGAVYSEAEVDPSGTTMSDTDVADNWEMEFMSKFKTKYDSHMVELLSVSVATYNPKTPAMHAKGKFLMDTGSTMFVVTPALVELMDLPKLNGCWTRTITSAIESGYFYAIGLNLTEERTKVTHSFEVPACSTPSASVNLLSLKLLEMTGWSQDAAAFVKCRSIKW